MTISRFAILSLVAALVLGYAPGPLADPPHPSNGITRTVEEHWPNGQLRLRKQVRRLDEGATVDHGTYERWYADGGREYVATFVDGRKDGVATRFHRNGRIATRQEFRDGQRHGARVDWDDSGARVKEEHWADDRPHGTWTIWRNGEVEWTHTYVHGDPTP